MALDDVYESATGGDLLAATATGHEFYPTEQQYMTDQRQALEYFALYPIITMGPILEASSENQGSKAQLASWYRVALGGVIEVAKPLHGEACYEWEGGEWNNVQCETREHCPLRICERYCSDMMSLPQLEGSEPEYSGLVYNESDYTVDPERTYDVAMVRLAAGVRAGILLQEYSEALRLQYHKWFEKRYPSDEIQPWPPK